MNTETETKKRLPETATLNGKKFLTPTQLAERLGIPQARLTIWRITGTPELPYYKFGKSIRYAVEEVEAFIRRNAKSNTGSR